MKLTILINNFNKFKAFMPKLRRNSNPIESKMHDSAKIIS